ncbi:hypothetical protein GGP41_000399 [Bipolaris sorokiniana]|uniref:Uncharacterized protein n=1 Tax=Cochliobolus sativus TaxID=45130 RepID=A0A8H5Z729_COCSA|nr:hypothetical protein GGP41_000399 [Bipolaris sorokiniana]
MQRSKEEATRYKNNLKPGDRQTYNRIINQEAKKLRESNFLTWDEVNIEKRNEVINGIIDQLKNQNFSEVKSGDVESSMVIKLKALIYEGTAENRAKKNASPGAATPAPIRKLPYDPARDDSSQQNN